MYIYRAAVIECWRSMNIVSVDDPDQLLMEELMCGLEGVSSFLKELISVKYNRRTS
jgi:hypothetical protein